MKVFFEKGPDKTAMPDYPIGALLRKSGVKGEIGIEIECEGNKFKKGDSIIANYWKYTKDGSLRGIDNAEYVLAQPIMFDQVDDAIDKLWKVFEAYGTKLDDSNRTSVHVHLNVQRFHLNRLAAFLGMYFAVEELLTAWCGEHRVGNLFCLRGKDAPNIVTQFKKFIQSNCGWEMSTGLHYAGMNGNALFKFGSLEIRSLRGCTDPTTIKDWVSVLRRMYEFSAEFSDPRTLVDSFSGTGPMAFLEMVLGDKTGIVRNGIAYDNQQVMEAMYDGIRLAQDICYCREWSEYNPVALSDDPFGRVSKKKQSFAEAMAQLAVNQGVAPVPSPSPSIATDDDEHVLPDWDDEDEDF